MMLVNLIAAIGNLLVDVGVIGGTIKTAALELGI